LDQYEETLNSPRHIYFGFPNTKFNVNTFSSFEDELCQWADIYDSTITFSFYALFIKRLIKEQYIIT